MHQFERQKYLTIERMNLITQHQNTMATIPCTMTSSNGNNFRVTGHLCGEFPAQRPVTRSFDIFIDLRLNKRLSKQSWGWWFETLSCPLWSQCSGLLRISHFNTGRELYLYGYGVYVVSAYQYHNWWIIIKISHGASFTKLLLKLGDGWAITSDCFTWINYLSMPWPRFWLRYSLLVIRLVFGNIVCW